MAAPDMQEETAWLSRPRQIQYDTAASVLFAIDANDRIVNSFTTDGVHLQTYGVEGEGPGEIKNIQGFALTTDNVAVLDVGNGKILMFDRETAEVASEVPVRRLVWDITAVGDSLIALLPGPSGEAFQLMTTSGDTLGAFGDGAFMPFGSCSCKIRHLGDGRIVIVIQDSFRGRIFDIDGTFRGIFGFDEMSEVIASWGQQFRERLRRAGVAIAAGAEGRLPAGKNWISDVVPYGSGEFYVTVTPEQLDITPREIWRLDGDGRVIGRYRFDRTWIGANAASFPRMFVVGIRDATIYEYRAGDQSP